VSPVLIREIDGAMRAKLDWSEADIIRQLKLIVRAATIVQPTVMFEAASDPDDDRILECAVAGRADLIVSYDRHLTKLRSFRGIPIVRPLDLLRTLGGV
jgi:uncharacterized protein